MLGRFLEIGIRAPDVLASLEFYESLGFVQAAVGDAWGHPYAVVTDGRLHLGLHQHRVEAPTLTWVHPELARHVGELQAHGIELAFSHLAEDAFHELGFTDPSGQVITLVEARTFSPPALRPGHATQLGYFEEFGIPTSDLQASAAFWDRLGFVPFDPVREPFPKIVAAARDLNVGLYDVDLRAPVLTFSDPRMNERIVDLRGKGFRFVERLPRGLDARANAMLEAPEGTWLLLTTGGD